MITLEGLRKVYPPTHGSGTPVVALDHVDLSVDRGEIRGIVGPSGAGKSTLVRCLTLLERPTSGNVVVDGANLTALRDTELRAARRRIGMVFQHVNLLDSRTAARNIAHPLEVAGVPRGERQARVRELLDLVGLGDRGDSYPGQLSGGQRQRVGIARALAARPDVLLCDEPTSALDPATTQSILDLIADVRDRLGITVLLITHEMSAVRAICDSVSLLELGKIVEEGPIAEVAADTDGRLSRELVPLPPTPDTVGLRRIDVSYATSSAGIAVLAALAELNADVAAGTVETLGGDRIGRFRIEVQTDDLDRVTHRLAESGATVEVAP